MSPKNEVSIPVAKLAPWDVLCVEGIAGCCLDGFVARNSAPLFNEAEFKGSDQICYARVQRADSPEKTAR